VCRVLHATHGLENFPVIIFGGGADDESVAQLAGAARFFSAGAPSSEILRGILECLPRAPNHVKSSVFHAP